MIAHPESSVPFSYLDGNRKSVGHALDLCVRLTETVRKKMGVKGDAGIALPTVTPANRPDPKALKVAGQFLTPDPLAIML